MSLQPCTEQNDFPEFTPPFGYMESFDWAEDVDDWIRPQPKPHKKTRRAPRIPKKFKATVSDHEPTVKRSEVTPRKYEGIDELVDRIATSQIISIDPANKTYFYTKHDGSSNEAVEELFKICVTRVKNGPNVFHEFLSQYEHTPRKGVEDYLEYTIKFSDVIKAKNRLIRLSLSQYSITDKEAKRRFELMPKIETIIASRIPIDTKRITQYTLGLERVLYVDPSFAGICKDYFKSGMCEDGVNCSSIHVSR